MCKSILVVDDESHICFVKEGSQFEIIICIVFAMRNSTLTEMEKVLCQQ